MKVIIDKIIRLFKVDGVLHIETSAIVLVFFLGVLSLFCPTWIAIVVAVILAAGVGLYKEIYDKITGAGKADVHDVLCDLGGIALGVALSLLFVL